MNKVKFKTINEWKMKRDKVKHLTTINFSGAYCTCGCHEISLFFVILGVGFFITINPTTAIPNVKTEEPKVESKDEKVS